jgi:hypothetical protein
MKTLLVLSQHPDFAEAIRTAADPESFRVVHRLNVDEAEPLLHGGLFNASIPPKLTGSGRLKNSAAARRKLRFLFSPNRAIGSGRRKPI